MDPAQQPFYLRAECGDRGMYEKQYTDQGVCFFGQFAQDVGTLFPEQNAVLIFCLPNGTCVQYNKARNILNTDILDANNLHRITRNGAYPIHVTCLPFPNPQPVRILTAGSIITDGTEIKTIELSPTKHVAELAATEVGFGEGTLFIHNGAVLDGAQNIEEAGLFDGHPVYLVHPGNSLFAVIESHQKTIHVEVRSEATVAQLKEALSVGRPYPPEIIELRDGPRVLADGEQVAEYDVLRGRVLTMKLVQPEQLTMTVIRPDGHNSHLSIPASSSLASLLRLVSHDCGLQPADVDLTVDGERVFPSMVLDEHPFHDGMVIRVYPKFNITVKTATGFLREIPISVSSIRTVEEFEASYLAVTDTHLSPRERCRLIYQGRMLQTLYERTLQELGIQPGAVVTAILTRSGCPCGCPQYSGDTPHLFFDAVPDLPGCPYAYPRRI